MDFWTPTHSTSEMRTDQNGNITLELEHSLFRNRELDVMRPMDRDFESRRVGITYRYLDMLLKKLLSSEKNRRGCSKKPFKGLGFFK